MASTLEIPRRPGATPRPRGRGATPRAPRRQASGQRPTTREGREMDMSGMLRVTLKAGASVPSGASIRSGTARCVAGAPDGRPRRPRGSHCQPLLTPPVRPSVRRPWRRRGGDAAGHRIRPRHRELLRRALWLGSAPIPGASRTRLTSGPSPRSAPLSCMMCRPDAVRAALAALHADMHLPREAAGRAERATELRQTAARPARRRVGRGLRSPGPSGQATAPHGSGGGDAAASVCPRPDGAPRPPGHAGITARGCRRRPRCGGSRRRRARSPARSHRPARRTCCRRVGS